MSNYKSFGKFHTWIYRLSGGIILGSVGLGRKILLLSATGRKSGEVRTSPLVYMADGERFVIYGSNGGQESPACLVAESAGQSAGTGRGGASASECEGAYRHR